MIEGADFRFDNGFRVVQFTLPGSMGSVQFGAKLTSATPGSVRDFYLVVPDMMAAREEIVFRGVDVSELFHPVAPGAQFQCATPRGFGYRRACGRITREPFNP